MKKIALATLLSLSAISVANANPRIFVQADLGVNYFTGLPSNAKSAYFLWRPTLGLEMGNHLIGIDYNPLTDDEFSDAYSHEKSSSFAVGLKYAYRFDLNGSKFKPYLGARASFNHWKNEGSYSNLLDLNYSASGTDFGLGLLAGVEYPITNNFSVGLNAEYNHIFQDYDDTNLLGFTGFVRYTF